MSGLRKSSTAKRISKGLDPANIFGRREGGIDWAGVLDPGGSFLEAGTGSKKVRKIADPGGLYSGQTEETAVTTTKKRGLTEAQKRTARAKKEKLARYQKYKTILSTDETLG